MIWAKVGGILAAIALCFAGGFWTGHTRGVAAVNALRAADARAATAALQKQVAATAAQTAKLEQVENAYDQIKNAPPDPIAVSVSRMLIARTTCGSPAVPGSPAMAAGTQGAAAEPGSAPPAAGGLAGALDGYIKACGDDAAQMRAMIALAP